ncbi:MAG: hypothetical protein IJU54_02200 [Alphaproteobacteria bacterium]|nr:hypothetical protein [Alphaproteobacteria bacterium]
MSYYIKNNNKLNGLLTEEIKAKEELEKINNMKQNSNVCDFHEIFLQDKINKLHKEIKSIMSGYPDNDNTIA